MILPAAYWDSSALIPVCVSQPQTANAQFLYEKYSVVTWWATQVEIISGLTRLLRMGQISHDRFLFGKQIAQNLVSGWIAVETSESICAAACNFLETYPLRAADALQLAAALEACRKDPHGYVFVTADQRLADAARQTGFSVELV